MEKVTISKETIKQLARAIAFADIAARAPKEKNPTITMSKNDLFYKAIEMARAGEKIKLTIKHQSMRSGETATHKAHNLEILGSSPSSATTHLLKKGLRFMKKIKDVKIGDIVACFDYYDHDQILHWMKVESIEINEYDGIVLYGNDIEDYGEDSITRVTKDNFFCIVTLPHCKEK